MNNSFDVLIIGSGAAGLTLALSLARQCRVLVLAKGDLAEGSTLYAQGGIAAVDHPADSVASHIEDTLIAGAGLSDPVAVHYVAEQGRQALQELIDLGVPFTRTAQEFHLTREGGHSHRRIFHAADATGYAIETTLLQQAKACPQIELRSQMIAIDLMTAQKLGGSDNRVLGCYVYNRLTDRVELFGARFVVLATGGASKVYLYTSNPDLSTGDGIAMAWRAGCRVANMEFNQFHPTCLYHPKAKSFLITEALRGEGALLKLPDGERFMDRFDPRAELAPRDIVARAIDHEMKRLGVSHLYLDISHQRDDFILSHFPTIYQRCLELGIDITRDPIPIVPAAHYTCGGVVTDLSAETDITNLFAIGETAFTGLHGANRMASNSLLECVVFAHSAAKTIMTRLDRVAPISTLPEWDESRVIDSDEAVVVSHNWAELRRFMWDYVGIVRTSKRLQRAKNRVDLLLNEIDEYYSHFRVNSDLIELRNLTLVADLIIRCALMRKESRGLHYTLDYPKTLPQAKNTVLQQPPAE
ncbi:L-aspartate oxidase [Ectothiorhodospiraceae bacterium BW-2]|nr:L-aspartate oxidase [Ectothiorhodospiraceae bacterium BW-2]